MKKDEKEVKLSAEFRAALEALPREKAPTREFEGRMVRALSLLGLIRSDSTVSKPRVSWIGVAKIAAILAIFASGVVLGHLLGSHQQVLAIQSPETASPWELAAQVQRTGSSHVAALGDLAERVANARPEEIELAREVALASLRASLQQMVMLDPTDPLPIRLAAELQFSLEQQKAVHQENEPWYVWF